MNAMTRMYEDYLREVVMPKIGMLHHWKVAGNNLICYPYQDDGRVGERYTVPLMDVMVWASKRL